MEIDTLSERSEEEDGEERQRRPQRGRRLSGKKRSISRSHMYSTLKDDILKEVLFFISNNDFLY
jgi:hypothetical protein